MDGLRFVVSHPFSPPRHGGRGGADSKRMAHPVWGDALIPKVMGGVPGRGSPRRKTWGVHRNVTRQSDGRYRFRESVWAMLARDGVPDGTRWGIWRPGREGEAACAAPKQPRTVAEAISVRRTSPQGVPAESFPTLSPSGGDDPVEQGEGTRRHGNRKGIGCLQGGAGRRGSAGCGLRLRRDGDGEQAVKTQSPRWAQGPSEATRKQDSMRTSRATAKPGKADVSPTPPRIDRHRGPWGSRRRG